MRRIKYEMQILSHFMSKGDIVAIAAVFALTILSAVTISFAPWEFVGNIPNIVEFARGFWFPEFHPLSVLLRKTAETFSMAVLGTFCGVIIALPVAFLGARNINTNLVVLHGVRLIFDVFRGVPEILWGLLLVAVFGLGPTTGVFALAIHEAGALGKYISETIETVDADLIDFLRSLHIPKWRWVVIGVYPAIKPLIVTYIFYYFEHNLRAATVLGIVGAGGIGFELVSAIKLYNFNRAAAVVVIILILVIFVDRLSGIVRTRILRHIQH